jgi:Glycosyltransferases involved in cell wall biogenesis
MRPARSSNCCHASGEVIPEAELILVDDGSTDATAAVAEEAGARVIRHPYGMGNGAAIKSGARAATGDILVFMDADGQHDPGGYPAAPGPSSTRATTWWSVHAVAAHKPTSVAASPMGFTTASPAS